MASNYPTSLDSLPTNHVDRVGETIFAADINNIADAVKKIQKAHGRVYGVKAYGAIGDGVTDDTSAIQSAINAASASPNGGRVVFDIGVYKLTSTLTVPSFVTLEGPSLAQRASEYGIDPAQLGAMITGPTATTFDLVKNSDPTNGNTSIQIKNLWLGVGTSTSADVSAIVFDKVRRSRIENCYIRGAVTTSRLGVKLQGIHEHNVIRDCFLEGCGIVSTGGNSLRVLRCEVAQGGVSITTGFDHRIEGCDIYQDGVGVGVAYPAYPNCISVTNVEGLTVRGNEVTASRQHGINLIGVSKGMIQGNRVKNSSQQTAGIWAGILLDTFSGGTPSADCVVSGNVSYDSGVNTQAYGVALLASVAGTTRITVQGNVFRGNTVAGYVATAGLANIYLRDNQGFVTESWGSNSVANGNTISHGLANTPTAVVATSRVTKHTVTVTARSSTTFTIGLTDDTGTAVAVAENVDWHAFFAPA